MPLHAAFIKVPINGEGLLGVERPLLSNSLTHPFIPSLLLFSDQETSWVLSPSSVSFLLPTRRVAGEPTDKDSAGETWRGTKWAPGHCQAKFGTGRTDRKGVLRRAGQPIAWNGLIKTKHEIDGGVTDRILRCVLGGQESKIGPKVPCGFQTWFWYWNPLFKQNLCRNYKQNRQKQNCLSWSRPKQG